MSFLHHAAPPEVLAQYKYGFLALPRQFSGVGFCKGPRIRHTESVRFNAFFEKAFGAIPVARVASGGEFGAEASEKRVHDYWVVA
ncbi:hypothetical protein GCM10023184_34900 [Flaviaesturariibacter amylovorans]|uniref:Uncharacterized protein n=1 Tax=Flaviaesturariibacter amylovorans TaxID=1084520 RepID=A0ABP8HEZ0_9BACT